MTAAARLSAVDVTGIMAMRSTRFPGCPASAPVAHQDGAGRPASSNATPRIRLNRRARDLDKVVVPRHCVDIMHDSANTLYTFLRLLYKAICLRLNKFFRELKHLRSLKRLSHRKGCGV